MELFYLFLCVTENVHVISLIMLCFLNFPTIKCIDLLLQPLHLGILPLKLLSPPIDLLHKSSLGLIFTLDRQLLYISFSTIHNSLHSIP